MTEANSTAGTGSSKSDLWIALGVIGCLALGASVTFLLSGKPDATAQNPQQPVPKGAPIAGPAAQPPGTATGTTSSTTTPPSKSTGDGDYMTVTFDTLSGYYYEIPDVVEPDKAPKESTDGAKRPKDQIPAPVRALNSRKVSIQGFMIPIKLDKGAAKTFLIVKDRSVCCFGRTPRMNEWVSVKMTGDKTTKFIADQPVTIFGTLEVGEQIENGEVLSIYRLNADDVAGPLDL
jgi:hypothetical protein